MNASIFIAGSQCMFLLMAAFLFQTTSPDVGFRIAAHAGGKSVSSLCFLRQPAGQPMSTQPSSTGGFLTNNTPINRMFSLGLTAVTFT